MNPDIKPAIITRSEHNVSRSEISENALKVLYRLNNSGYSAYLVGGGVRDILSGRHPKDFDIVTDAHPEQIKKLFRNCRLIGRRFRLAHVCFGREIIEVATFRASGDAEVHDTEVHAETGRILRDNVYGTIDDDIWRRDFTANALYYNIDDFSVVDYVGGLTDIQNKIIRPIGDPDVRLREDPVRMLRAVRFAAKFDWQIESKTGELIKELSPLIVGVPPARLFDEMLKLFLHGAAQKTLNLLREYGLFEHLFPRTHEVLVDDKVGPIHVKLLDCAMRNTDLRIQQEKPVTPAFLFAALHWAPVHGQILAMRKEGAPPAEATQASASFYLYDTRHQITIPKRFSVQIRDIWNIQHRLEHTSGRRPLRLLTHPKFRAGYDFLLLRAEAGDADPELADWWTKFQESTPDSQKQSVLPKRGRNNRRRSKSRKSAKPSNGSDE